RSYEGAHVARLLDAVEHQYQRVRFEAYVSERGRSQRGGLDVDGDPVRVLPEAEPGEGGGRELDRLETARPCQGDERHRKAVGSGQRGAVQQPDDGDARGDRPAGLARSLHEVRSAGITGPPILQG